MSRNEALELIRDYCLLLRVSEETDETLTGLYDRFPKDGSENKAMRWLGFMQGVLYINEVFTLDEIKEHSRLRKVTESNDQQR